MKFVSHIPFVELLGMELEHFEGGQARIALTLRDELMNSWGVAHGGVSMTLLDVVMAHAARSPAAAGGDQHPSVVTVEMKTSFTRAGTGRLVAHGKVLHRTATLAFCEGSIFDERGELTAHASGTFKYLHGLPVGGRRVQRQDASD